MDINDLQVFVAVPRIVWIDRLLSGDNAIAIAVAFRGLPEERRCTGLLPSRRRSAMQEKPRG